MQDDQKNTSSIIDVKQLGFWASISSLGYVFWICGGMEMVERLAFYGVRYSTQIYATTAQSQGGLGLVGQQLGEILLVWALIQSFVPVFTGGISDRYGYKETIFASTIFKIMGYLLMAWFPTYWGFMAGAAVLAFGTAIFKPGLQGTIVRTTNRQNSSMAWAIFYQTVNIGGFMGPILAGYLRQMDWSYVFYACAAIISLNFLLLLTYKEQDKEERLARNARVKAGTEVRQSLWRQSLKELSRPVVIWYVVLLSGFWFMLWAYWDISTLYFRDWVDSRDFGMTLFGPEGPNVFFKRFFTMSNDGTRVLPEGLLNINGMLIMFTCFIVAGLSGKLKAANSMAIGTFAASAALLLLGGFNGLWVCVAAIFVFSMGEMLASPKSSEYMGNIAPQDKKAMYIGFSQLPLGIGWSIESYMGQILYQNYGSKEQISREVLSQKGLSANDIQSIPIGEAFDRLVQIMGQTPEAVTTMLYQSHDIWKAWILFPAVGIICALGLWVYGRWTYRIAQMDQQQT